MISMFYKITPYLSSLFILKLDGTGEGRQQTAWSINGPLELAARCPKHDAVRTSYTTLACALLISI